MTKIKPTPVSKTAATADTEAPPAGRVKSRETLPNGAVIEQLA